MDTNWEDTLVTTRLVDALLSPLEEDVLNLMNRLLEIAEVPELVKHSQVRSWVNQLAKSAACGEGFSFSGACDDLLVCYNAMITSVLIRLDYPDQNLINQGISWILKYQKVNRHEENCWQGGRAKKYGGCLKATPCYIGLVKSMVALSDYKHSPQYVLNPMLEDKLARGLAYILDHSLYLRKSTNTPITKDILKLTFPFSYKTNMIEILKLLKTNGLLNDERCEPAKAYLRSKCYKDGYWRCSSYYSPKFWVDFDQVKAPGLWISREIRKLLE